MAQMTEQILQAFADAWNRHDIDALMSFMTEDCVFEANAGPDAVGTRFHGTEAVRRGFQRAWNIYPDARWSDARHFVSGDRGASESIFLKLTKAATVLKSPDAISFDFAATRSS